MSVNATHPELTQLIYCYLKEQGFHSAADELQTHIPQALTKTSLLDIYSSWLNDSKKKKKKPNLAKHSSCEEPRRPLSKATPRKMKDKPASKTEIPTKSVPAKREKRDGNVTTAKKSKSHAKDPAGGDDSDSDSSLDVDKWKKLVLTEFDIAKMDTLKALDSSATPPIIKRVRKSRAKPPVKNDTVGKNKTVDEKAMTQTSTTNSAPKRSRTKKTAPVTSSSSSSATPSQAPNANAVKDSAATPSQTPKKEKRKDVNPSKENTNEATSEPNTTTTTTTTTAAKKKKKKTESKVEENTHETGGDGKDKDSIVEKQQDIRDDNPAEEKKNAKRTKRDKKSINSVEEAIEKNKSGDGNLKNQSEPIVQEKKTDETNSEPVAEKVNENSELIAEGKKAKKKRKKIAHSEETSEQIAEEENVQKKKKKIANSEETSDQIAEEEKVQKKKKKIANSEETSEQIAEEEKVQKKKKKIANSEETSEQIAEEEKVRKKRKKIANSEETSEQIAEEEKVRKKRKKIANSEETSESIAEEEKVQKRKENPDQILTEKKNNEYMSVKTIIKKSESSDEEKKTEQNTETKKKTKKDSLKNNDTLPLAPPSLGACPSTEKKKKKTQLKSAEVTVSTPDSAVTQTHKKKKKSSTSTGS
ncbi:nucleolar and coiled-body phosphoprotein 1 isoform X2 [Pseudoliparis swirei]|uniref:nucleolar and coiled-body phosphoprotein 1 isoform X2 n=1 Tax=Pseudoliparis swirei TaxID=2059687 RepID=UPI0024BED499|nr:nucleolar and coiled-body phosphoprotein 1 isoform X2 [Pseudoliparis swirei]